MDECTDEAVQRLLPLVSAQRQEEAMKFRHTFGRFACLKSYVMLMEALGISPTEKPQFEYGEHGKPFIKDHPIHFNISHCKRGIAVAVSPSPIGIDIESIQRGINESLVKRVMNEAEREEIVNHKQPKLDFTRLWTRKEAVLKLRGTGLTDQMQDVLSSGKEHIQTFVNKEKGYVWSVASNEEADTDIIICR